MQRYDMIMAGNSCALTVGRSIDFLNDDTLVFRSGNTIVFYSIAARKQTLLQLPAGTCLDSYALAPAVSKIALATHSPARQVDDQTGAPQLVNEIRISIFNFPALQCERTFTLGSDEVFPLTHLSLSRRADRLVTISSMLNRHLIFWSLPDEYHPASNSPAAEKVAEYYWNQNGGIDSTPFVLQPPASYSSASINPGAGSSSSGVADTSSSSGGGADWSGSNPLLSISFHPKNHHEFVTITARAVVWWKLTGKVDGRVLSPLEVGVYSRDTRKILPSEAGAAALEKFNTQFKVDTDTAALAVAAGLNPNMLAQMERNTSSVDSEGTLAYLRALGTTLASTGAPNNSTNVPHNPLNPSALVLNSLTSSSLSQGDSNAEFTASFSTRTLKAIWKAGSFASPSPPPPGHRGHAHHANASFQQHHLHQASSTNLTGSFSTASTERSMMSEGGGSPSPSGVASQNSSEPNTERESTAAAFGQVGGLDESSRSFSSASLLHMAPSNSNSSANLNAPNSNLGTSASAPVLNLSDGTFDNSLPGSSLSSAHNSTANLKALVPAGGMGSPSGGYTPGSSGRKPSTMGLVPMPPIPSNGPPSGPHQGRKRSIFWGSSSSAFGGASNLGATLGGGGGAAQPSKAQLQREFMAAWEEEQRRALLTDALEHGSNRRLTGAHTWTPEGQLVCATNGREILIYSRGWMKQSSSSGAVHSASANHGESGSSDANAPQPTPSIHLQIIPLEIGSINPVTGLMNSAASSDVAIVALATTKRFLLAGTSDGRVLWLDPTNCLSVHASKLLSERCGIWNVSFAPGYRHFAVVDREGIVQLVSTVSGGQGSQQSGPSMASAPAPGSSITIGSGPPLSSNTSGSGGKRPSSGGSEHGSLSHSSSSSMFARPHVKNAFAEESKESKSNEEAATSSINQQQDKQLRIHSFTLTRFPLSVLPDTPSTVSSATISHTNAAAAAAAADSTPAAFAEEPLHASFLPYLIELLPRTGRLALANTRTSEVHILNVKTKEFLASFRFPNSSQTGASHSPISCISSSPDGLLLCVGFENGYIALLDACPPLAAANNTLNAAAMSTENFELRVVFYEQVHLGAVNTLKFNPGGSHLFSLGRSDNFLYFFRCRDWKLHGYINVPSRTSLCAEWLNISGQNKVFISLHDGQLLIVSPPDPLFEPTHSLLLSESVAQVLVGETEIACTAFINDPLNERGFFAVGVDKKLRRFQWEKMEAFEASQKGVDGSSHPTAVLKPVITTSASDSWLSHLKLPSVLAASPDGEWIASGGRDGVIVLRRTHEMNAPPIVIQAHVSFPEFELDEITTELPSSSTSSSTTEQHKNGVTSLRFSNDSKQLLSSGVDGGVFLLDIASLAAANHLGTSGGASSPRANAINNANSSFSPASASNLLPTNVAAAAGRLVQSMTPQVLKELPPIDLSQVTFPPDGVHAQHAHAHIDPTYLGARYSRGGNSADYNNPLDLLPTHTSMSSAAPITYLDFQLSDVIARNQNVHSEQSKLAAALANIKTRMDELAQANAHADPLERLPDPTEFIIDVAQLERLRKGMAAKVAATKELIHQENLAKELVLERVRKQCWDSMEVKGCMLRSMTPSASNDKDDKALALITPALVSTTSTSGAIVGNTPSGSPGTTTTTTTYSAANAASSLSASATAGVIEVSNFPIRALSAKERAILKKVEFQRRMGVEEEKWIAANQIRPVSRHHDYDDNGERLNTPVASGHATLGSITVGRYGEFAATKEGNYIIDNFNGVPRTDADAHDDNPISPRGGGGLGSPSSDAGDKSNPAAAALSPLRQQLLASEKLAAVSKAAEAQREKNLAIDRDRDSEWNDEGETRTLFHPTMLFTSIRKRTQIHLLSLKIDRLKRKFNMAFQTLYENKREAVEMIVHKIERIMEIQEELSIEGQPFTPALSVDERPDSILTVSEDEIKVEKRLTPEEAAAREKEMRARAKDATDEANLRALNDMMFGTLENKKSDLHSLVDLVRPAWMSQISSDALTEEQKQQIAEFDQAEKNLKIERETRQRLLETELKKLRSDVNDLMRLFDHRLRHLFQQRLNVLKRIQREEYAQLSLVNDILLYFEIQPQQIDKFFQGFQVELRNNRNMLTQTIQLVKRALSNHAKKHEGLVTEERNLEKNFRRDFTTILSGIVLQNPATGVLTPATEWVEYLFRLFKSRPVLPEIKPATAFGGRHAPHASTALNQSGMGIPGLNLSGLTSPSASSAGLSGSVTDRTGLASALNPLLGQAGAKKQRPGAGGSMTSRGLGPAGKSSTGSPAAPINLQKASRIMRDLSGLVDTSDIAPNADPNAAAINAALNMARPSSTLSQGHVSGDDDVNAYESLVPPASIFAARPPSPGHEKKKGNAQAGASNLAFVLSKQKVPSSGGSSNASSTEKSDDPFPSTACFDLDADLGEFNYVSLDFKDCPFELRIPPGAEDTTRDPEERDTVSESLHEGVMEEEQLDENGNPIPTKRGSISSVYVATKPITVDEVDDPSRTYANVWMKLNERRSMKFQRELEVRSSAFILAEMQRTLHFLEGQNEAMVVVARTLSLRQQAFTTAVSSAALNTELMLRLQQGLVEINESPVVTDLNDCVMIERATLESLNTRILTIGGDNVALLREMQKFRRGIRSKQWERSRLALLHADAEDLTKELQLLRVTKALQALIKAGGQDNKAAQELSMMERKAAHVQEMTREDIELRQKKMSLLRAKIRHSQLENVRLEHSIEALHTIVDERKQIAQFNSNAQEIKDNADRRIAGIADRRHLLNLLENQKQLMATLHSEREKLRSKTYPSFASLKANPPQLSLLPDDRDGVRMLKGLYAAHVPKPPSVVGGLGLSGKAFTSPRLNKTRL